MIYLRPNIPKSDLNIRTYIVHSRWMLYMDFKCNALCVRLAVRSFSLWRLTCLHSGRRAANNIIGQVMNCTINVLRCMKPYSNRNRWKQSSSWGIHSRLLQRTAFGRENMVRRFLSEYNNNSAREIIALHALCGNWFMFIAENVRLDEFVRIWWARYWWDSIS